MIPATSSKQMNPYYHCYSIDINHRVNSCNEQQAQTLMMDKKAVIGQFIGDLVPQSESTVYLNNNETVMQKGIPLILWEPCMLANGFVRTYVSYKAPLRNLKGRVIGLTGFSLILKEELLSSIELNAQSSDGIIGTLLYSISQQPGTSTSYYDKESGKYHLGEQFADQWLTQGEYRVLQELILGKTNKEIASELHYSPRTVEDYVYRIKTKLNCSKRHQVIQWAITNGIMNIAC